MVKEFTEREKFPQIKAVERRPYKRRTVKKDKEYENNDHRLKQRLKQIQYGENTPGYENLMKALAVNPTLLKGCIPVKPSILQKCSKRSWDGQIRKWRRALHMYDFVDFGESDEQTQLVREALIEQNKNPIFIKSPSKILPNGQEVLLSAQCKTTPDVILEDVDVKSLNRVRYTAEDLMRLSDSPLVDQTITLPENLHWLDNRIDLEDDIEDDIETDSNGAATPSKNSSFTPGYSPSSQYSNSPSHSYSYSVTPVRLFNDTTSNNTVPRSYPGAYVTHTSLESFVGYTPMWTSVVDCGATNISTLSIIPPDPNSHTTDDWPESPGPRSLH